MGIWLTLLKRNMKEDTKKITENPIFTFAIEAIISGTKRRDPINKTPTNSPYLTMPKTNTLAIPRITKIDIGWVRFFFIKSI